MLGYYGTSAAGYFIKRKIPNRHILTSRLMLKMADAYAIGFLRLLKKKEINWYVPKKLFRI